MSNHSIMMNIVKTIRPLIAIVEHIRRELSWGMTFEESPFLRVENQIVKIFQPLAIELGEALVLSMSAVENIIFLAFQKSATRQDLTSDLLTLVKANDRLVEARDAAREALQRFSDESDMEQRQAIDQRDLDSALFSPETFDLCLFIISLIQVCHQGTSSK
jgi:predicted nucleic-acid-binding protein